MGNIDISIIVPVYNVEKYLEKCLESLVNQTLKNIEIILVNDGSTDSSKNICERYVEKDKRVILVNQVNKGQSAARNKGIEIARGNYIGFVDSDDYIELDMYEILYEKLIQEDADITICQVNMVNSEGQVLSNNINKNKKGYIENGNDAIIRYLKNGRWGLCDKLYKARFIKNIKFLEGKSCGEDHLGIISILKNTKKIVTIETYLYNYVMRENSTTTAGFSVKSFDIPHVWEEILKEAVSLKNAEFIELVEMRKICSYVDLVNEYIKSGRKEFSEEVSKIRKKLRDNRKKILTNKLIFRRYKLGGVLIGVFWGVYVKVYIISRGIKGKKND